MYILLKSVRALSGNDSSKREFRDRQDRCTMKAKKIVWLMLLGLAVVLTACLKYVPYLPGDVSITRLIQSGLPASMGWAYAISATAKMPWLLALIVVTFIGSWFIAGWRAAALSLASYVGLWLLGMGLGPIIVQPRPSPDLVQVAESLSGSAFPSIFAFNYMATIGFLGIVAAMRATGMLRWAIVLFCAALLIAGGIARIGLAAHWPSDVALSYLIGFLWVTLLMRFG